MFGVVGFSFVDLPNDVVMAAAAVALGGLYAGRGGLFGGIGGIGLLPPMGFIVVVGVVNDVIGRSNGLLLVTTTPELGVFSLPSMIIGIISFWDTKSALIFKRIYHEISLNFSEIEALY